MICLLGYRNQKDLGDFFPDEVVVQDECEKVFVGSKRLVVRLGHSVQFEVLCGSTKEQLVTDLLGDASLKVLQLVVGSRQPPMLEVRLEMVAPGDVELQSMIRVLAQVRPRGDPLLHVELVVVRQQRQGQKVPDVLAGRLPLVAADGAPLGHLVVVAQLLGHLLLVLALQVDLGQVAVHDGPDLGVVREVPLAALLAHLGLEGLALLARGRHPALPLLLAHDVDLAPRALDLGVLRVDPGLGDLACRLAAEGAVPGSVAVGARHDGY
ncbi:hypothetical protein PG985_011437 [Apiospora marii]|uniref:Uncharacterized protein n=1 Tax=Apiospora marii TaxID=335849 RepID=A0ABR1STN0_9PEZI